MSDTTIISAYGPDGPVTCKRCTELEQDLAGVRALSLDRLALLTEVRGRLTRWRDSEAGYDAVIEEVCAILDRLDAALGGDV